MREGGREESAGDHEGDRAPHAQGVSPSRCVFLFVSFTVGCCWFCPESRHLLCFSACRLSQHRGSPGWRQGIPGSSGWSAQRLPGQQWPRVLNSRREQRHVPRSRARPCAFCAFSGRGAACALCIPADVPPIPGTRSGCRPERPGFEPSQHPGQVRPTVTCELSVLICEIHVTTGPFFFFFAR